MTCHGNLSCNSHSHLLHNHLATSTITCPPCLSHLSYAHLATPTYHMPVLPISLITCLSCQSRYTCLSCHYTHACLVTTHMPVLSLHTFLYCQSPLSHACLVTPTSHDHLGPPTSHDHLGPPTSHALLVLFLGPRVLDQVLTPLLLGISEETDESEIALDALRQLMAVKSRVVLPHVVPQLIQPPVNIRALALLTSVAG